MSRPPNIMVKSSIEYSGLLITRTFHRYKHQLRDFFNRHACYHPSSQLAFYELQGKNQYENSRAVCVDQYCQRTDVCKCLHLIGRRKVMGQRYSGVHRSREGILQDGKSSEFFSDMSPLNQVLALAVLVLFWKSSSPIRMCLAAAFVLYVL